MLDQNPMTITRNKLAEMFSVKYEEVDEEAAAAYDLQGLKCNLLKLLVLWFRVQGL